ncbi:MAG: tyrosine recombinase XerC [Mycobacteriales bacterium]
MAKRRSRGDGGLHWDEKRQRWIATVTIGYNARGKRITKKASGKTKTEANTKLKELHRDLEDGFTIAPGNYTVGDAVNGFLAYGLSGRSRSTRVNYRYLADTHIIPNLARRKLQSFSAEDVDAWLAEKARTLSTRTVRLLHSILSRSMRYAQARDKVKRNVVALCEPPTGQPGRPSKSLTYAQAEAVLAAADDSPLHAYIELSLLVGARTEELRALGWDHVVAFDEERQEWRPVKEVGWQHEKFAIYVWRSVRAGGDTKTQKSRRSLAISKRSVNALYRQEAEQRAARQAAGNAWQEHGLVFTSKVGTPLDASNVRKGFRKVVTTAGLDPAEWTPRELRHSFVSLLSNRGVRIEDIARLVGHTDTRVTETVYRHQLRPVITEGAEVMDEIFPEWLDGS